MIVSDILRRKGTDVVTVTPDTTVWAMIGMLAEHRIGALVVCTEGSTSYGFVSERDVVRGLAARGAEVLHETVGQICTYDAVTVAPDCRVADLRGVMTHGRFRHVPVVAAGRLQGIVSIGDVVKSSISELEFEREALSHYITAG